MTRILIVDDDALAREALNHLLTKAGYEVTVRANGHEALEALRAGDCRLVVSDWMMPVMDGAAFLRERARVPALAAVPTLVLTAHPYHFRVLDGLSPTAVLRKPYDVDELIAAVEDLCEGETGRGRVC